MENTGAIHPKLFMVVNVDWFFLSHRLPVALAAAQAGWNVTIVTSDTGRLDEIREKGFNVIHLPMDRSGMNILHECKTLLFLYRLYRRECPDVIHHVGMKVILWGSLACRLGTKCGVVNAISGLGGFFAKEPNSLLMKLMVGALRYSHRNSHLLCIFQNQDDWELYEKNGIIKHDRGRLIRGSGVDLADFCYTPEPETNKIRVVLTARMIVEKGIFLLTEAAEKLRSKYEGRVEFLLVGGLDDHPGAITEDQLAAVCDGNYIQWLGYRSDVRDLLKNSSVVALPSFYMEGLPKSLIEACAIGRPIVTSNSVGCKEAVVDGFNGFSVRPLDVNDLASKLDLLLSNKEMRVRMGRNSRELAEKNFDVNDVIKRHLSIYNELLR